MTPLDIVVAVLYLILGAIVYFTPYLVAKSRHHHNRTAIGLLNLFLGWTLLGWVGALVWAVMKPARQN